jgi:hypothetical protein
LQPGCIYGCRYDALIIDLYTGDNPLEMLTAEALVLLKREWLKVIGLELGLAYPKQKPKPKPRPRTKPIALALSLALTVTLALTLALTLAWTQDPNPKQPGGAMVVNVVTFYAGPHVALARDVVAYP